MAYPIYLTIGNIPKDIRRKPSRHAQLLIGYIPTTKLAAITSEAARRRTFANLFHTCMQTVLGPIALYGETGIPMMSGDGIWRRCHPIFANFVGDYPEQTLVTCTYYGRCPKCKVPPELLGEYQTFPSRVQSSVIDTYLSADADTHAFYTACHEEGMKPIYRPFWESFPLADIFLSVTPDILHQMLQGMVKHLIVWIVRVFGSAAINARSRAIPPNHKTTLFPTGILKACRLSGQEHKRISSILLGLILDLPAPDGRDPSRIVRTVRALMDFLFIAQYQCQTSDTIQQLEDCLSVFHENKNVFVDLGVREHFNLPKLHSLSHYASSIRLFGTTDNYNTEHSERLHIEFAKDAYRASNRKEEYFQMTKWLERREKVQLHATIINWRKREHHQRSLSHNPMGPPRMASLTAKMAQNPSKRVSFNDLAADYGALHFQDALGDFIAQVNNPGAAASTLHNRSRNTLIPFSRVPVFHHFKFTKSGDSDESEIVDAVHVRPEQRDSRGRIIPPRFDTVLVRSRGPKGT
jgi:Plavaka transposase